MINKSQQWTVEQQAAIDERGGDILVAAGAGAGKTAVLVQRIIQRLTDKESPLNIDHLLIVTFTKAAAAEMRKRISDALLKLLSKDPDNERLKQQLNLLDQAAIETLHSFCFRVIQTYNYKLDIDPSFRIGEENEMLIIRQEVMENLLEQCYKGAERERELFLELVDSFGGERSDDGLGQIIFSIYNMICSQPQPENWLEKTSDLYNIDDAVSLDDIVWISVIKQHIQIDISGMIEDYCQIIQFITGCDLYNVDCSQVIDVYGLQQHQDIPPYVEANLIPELIMLKKTASACAESWDALANQIKEIHFDRLKTKRNTEDHYAENVKKLRDEVKKQLKYYSEFYFSRTRQQYIADIQHSYPLVKQLTNLTIRFKRQYHQYKQKLGVLDFNDLEYYCLKIMTEPIDGGDQGGGQIISASPEARQLRQQFSEIYVDEYQDINNVQETILNLLSSENLFMVGDVKQSIYRFRLADPGLFMYKYMGDDSLVRKIDLQSNFRSRPEILNAVNFVFRQIMGQQAGEIIYDKKAELNPGIDFPHNAENSLQGPVEIHLLDKKAADNYSAIENDEEEDEITSEYITSLQLEARLIAGRIKKMTEIDNLLVYDNKNESYRPLTLRDIVILLPTANITADIFMQEMEQQGIGSFAELASGWLESQEILTMINLLKILDNPRQDIPLASILRSPLIGLSSDEMACIRLAGHRLSLFDALTATAASEPIQQISEINAELQTNTRDKAREFLVKLDEWRTAARSERLQDVLRRIMINSGYYDFIGGLPDGVQRQANLRILVERAGSYQAHSGKGLFAFLQYLDKITESGHDLPEARTLGENEDVVRIMSIHKSKGLEFPVVFLADAGHSFNMKDMNSQLLIHKDLGIGMAMVDPEEGFSYPGLPQQAIKQQIRSEILSEQMRVLYVAMTRAREKLIISGSVNNLASRWQKWERALYCRKQLLPDRMRLQAATFLDWLMPALMRHPSAAVCTGDKELSDRISGYNVFREYDNDESRWDIMLYQNISSDADDSDQSNSAISLQSINDAAITKDSPCSSSVRNSELLNKLRGWQPVTADDLTVFYQEHISDWPVVWRHAYKQVSDIFDWKYPYPAVQQAAKVTVTEVKDLFSEIAEDYHSVSRTNEINESNNINPSLKRPQFMLKQGLTGAEYGTALHLVLRHLDLQNTDSMKAIDQQIIDLYNREILNAEQAARIKRKDIYSFANSELGRRMASADEIYRELPFTLSLPWQELARRQRDPSEKEGAAYELSNAQNQECVILQGELDCIIREGDRWTLIDYKTDRPYTDSAEDEERTDVFIRKITQRYSGQLALYQLACERIMNINISEKCLYLFSIGKTVNI